MVKNMIEIGHAMKFLNDQVLLSDSSINTKSAIISKTLKITVPVLDNKPQKYVHNNRTVPSAVWTW